MYISIDVGTTNLKMTLIDEDYKVYNQVSYRYEHITMTQSAFEMDIEEIWQAVMQGIDQLVEESGFNRHYDIILTTAMHSVVLLDKDFKAKTKVYAWNDSRGAKEIDLLTQEEQVDQYLRTGTPIHSMNPYFKLKYWLSKHQDVLVGSIKDYLFYQLTGEWLIDQASASASGLYQVNNQNWDDASLNSLDLTTKELPVVYPSIAYRMLKVDLAPSIEDCKVYLGTTDGVASNYACRSLTDSAVLTIGTSHAVRVISNKPSVDDLTQNFCYHIKDQEYLVGYPSNNGGNVFEWIASNYATTFEYLDEISRLDLTPKATFLPFLNGERSPLWDDHATAELVNMHRDLSRDELLFSMTCGVMFNIRMNIENLANQADFSKLCLVGGMMKNLGFVQLLSDITGRDIHVPIDHEAERLGSVALVRGEVLKLDYEVTVTKTERFNKLNEYYQIYCKKIFEGSSQDRSSHLTS